MTERSEDITAARAPASRTSMGSAGASPRETVTETVTSSPASPAPVRERSWSRYCFFGLAAAGIVVSLGLGIHEVHNRPALKVSSARVKEDGLTRTVQVNVKNRSTHTWCPVVLIAARKRNGADLDLVQAEPVDGKGKVAPKQTVGFKFVFDQLTQKDLDRLDKFVGYVDSQVEC